MGLFKSNKLNSVSKDLLYSVAGLCLMNGVVQLLVNPFLQKQLGSERFGTVLSLISVLSIIAITIGTSLNYSRMIASAKKRECNGDYFLFLIVSAAVSVPISLIALCRIDRFSALGFIGYAALTALTAARYYADVNYRLDTDFKGFFIFYALMSAGYAVGVLMFRFTGWLVTYLLAELAALAFVAARGKIFRCSPFKTSPHVKSNLKSYITLAGTNLITSVLSNVDRLLILSFIDPNAVTVFYTASLFGKVIAILTAPLNGVIISHLAKYDGTLRRKTFAVLNGIMLFAAAVISVVCIAASFIFVKIMYSNVYEEAKSIIPIATIGQVFYFISGTVMVVLMRFTKERIQFVINGLFFVAYIALSVSGIERGGLFGFAVGVLIANALRMLLTFV
ncbi:MAG: hypothetical protein K6C14_01625, partial [Eubacterium sp.]|nr:hypothetical protein [Eubacterium sp.]